MSWSLKFDEPIEVGKGEVLRTLRDAGDHIIALSPSETKQPHWHTAVACLLSASEKRGSVVIARIAMMHALNSGKAPPSENGKAPPSEHLRAAAHAPAKQTSRRRSR